jgi:hypothetical protein
MNDERSEYLRQAAFCRGMAAEANTLERKAAWLRLASKWLALMAEDLQPVMCESFDPVSVNRKRVVVSKSARDEP